MAPSARAPPHAHYGLAAAKLEDTHLCHTRAHTRTRVLTTAMVPMKKRRRMEGGILIAEIIV